MERQLAKDFASTVVQQRRNTKVVLISRFSTRSFELAAKLMSKLNIRSFCGSSPQGLVFEGFGWCT